MTAHAHVNHVRFFKGDDANISSGTVLYTPPTVKVLDVKQIVVSFTGDANATCDIYNDTAGTDDQVMALVYDYDANSGTQGVIHLKDLSGFTFSKAFRVVATSSKVNIAVSGILI